MNETDRLIMLRMEWSRRIMHELMRSFDACLTSEFPDLALRQTALSVMLGAAMAILREESVRSADCYLVEAIAAMEFANAVRKESEENAQRDARVQDLIAKAGGGQVPS